MQEGNVVFSRHPGCSALQNCFNVLIRQGGLWAQGGLRELFNCFHALLRAAVPGTYCINASGKDMLGIINQCCSGFLLHRSCSVVSFSAAHFGCSF